MPKKFPVCVSSYVEYAGHQECESPLIQQIRGIPSIAHPLSLCWMFVAGNDPWVVLFDLSFTDLHCWLPVLICAWYSWCCKPVYEFCRAPSHSSFVQIDGEDIRQFIAGLAENIMLDNTRAARIVTAAVAARTRSLFLQAWVILITWTWLTQLLIDVKNQ